MNFVFQIWNFDLLLLLNNFDRILHFDFSLWPLIHTMESGLHFLVGGGFALCPWWWRSRRPRCRFLSFKRLIRPLIILKRIRVFFYSLNFVALYPELLLYDPFEGKLPQESFILTRRIELKITFLTLNHKWKRPSISYWFINISLRLIFVFGLNDEAAKDVGIFNVLTIVFSCLVNAQLVKSFALRLLRITTHVVVDSQFLGLVIKYKESFIKIKFQRKSAPTLRPHSFPKHQLFSRVFALPFLF